MKKKSLVKRAFALVLSAMLLVEPSCVYAAKNVQTVRTMEADKNGFVIENGVLEYYEGDAEEVTVPEGVIAIGESAFWEHDDLRSIIIPEGVVSIGDGAFYSCDRLSSITIPEGVRNIEDGAFRYCYSLSNIIIPKSVTSIGDGAFWDCDSLNSIIIPEGVISIGYGTFYNCDNLSNVTILEGVTSIGEWAFYHCDRLSSIIIPKSVTSIGYEAFEDCDRLSSITIPEGVTSIGDEAFSSCHGLSSITIPKSVISIGNGVFWGCERLSSIIIPESVISIGDGAFENCNEKLTIYCFENSYAHKYAMEKNIKYILIEQEIEPIIETYTGELQAISALPLFCVTIDGVKYYLRENCELGRKLTNTYVEEKTCQVIYNLVDGKIDKIDLLEDCVELKVKEVKLDTNSISYDNGKFSPDKVQLSMELSCIVTENCYSSVENNVGILVEDLNISVSPYSGLYLEKGWFKKKYEKTEEAFKVNYKNPQIKTFDIYINGDEPEDIIDINQISVTINEKIYTCSLTINNLQKQREEVNKKEKQKNIAKATEKVKNNLNKNVKVVLPPVVEYYLSSSQQEELRQFLAVYIAEIFNTQEITAKSSWLDDVIKGLTERVKEQFQDACFKQLGIDAPEVNIYSYKYNVPIKIQATNKNKKKIELDFILDIDANAINDKKVNSAYIEISCKVPEKYKIEGDSQENVKGMVTYVAIEHFIDAIKDVAKATYMEMWGDNVDKLIESIIQDPLKELTGGIFSVTGFFGADCVYQITTKAEEYLTSPKNKNTSKTVNIKTSQKTSRGLSMYSTSYISMIENKNTIPVNVFVYDSEGTLCGVLKNGLVESCSNGVFIDADTTNIFIYLLSDDYSIKIEGTEDSDINYSINEYFNGEKVRETISQNVSLKEGVSYESYVPDSLLVSANVYQLQTEDGTKLNSMEDIFISQCMGLHEYQYENLADGTRLVTCKICGNSYVEDINNDENINTDETINEENNMSIENAEIVLSKNKYSYNGKQKKPTIKSVQLNNKELILGTDYEVTYKNNKNIGTASVIITGIGEYDGSITKEFSIVAKKGTSFTVDGKKYKLKSSSTVAFTGLKNKSDETVTIPDKVKIGGKNFKVTAIANKALKDTNIKKVTIGSNVKTIGVSAFEGCKKLITLTIGGKVTKIGNKAFKGCKALKSITIPSKVTTIGQEVFRNCSKLEKITIKSTKLKSVGKNAFKGIKSNATIKVNAKKLSEYKKLLKGKGQGSKVKIKK